jgi:cytochrome c-type biogenesis protein CcmH/NrfG
MIAAAIMALPTSLFAAGGGDSSAPTKPVNACEGSKVYDEKTKTCVDPQSGSLQIDQLYETVRQLAYAERYEDAQVVLAAMPENDDRRLTYMGFVERKLGHVDSAMAFYTRAIQQNPANILARSYMGQGMVEQGQIAMAMEQLQAIRAHGGTGTWAEASLRTAIATGQTYNY